MVAVLTVAAVALQTALLGAVVTGIRRRNVAVTVNAAVALAAALTPSVVQVAVGSAAGRAVGPELPLWIAAAGVLHCIGMFGLYESVWWWDHLAHTVSGALVAALVYAGLLVAGGQAGVALPARSLHAATVLAVLLAGVFWELIELVARDLGDRFGVQPVLVHYGWRDTALDLVFDVIGAFAVVLFDLRLFVPIAEAAPGVMKLAVLAGGGGLVVGSLLLALVVWFGSRERPWSG